MHFFDPKDDKEASSIQNSVNRVKENPEAASKPAESKPAEPARPPAAGGGLFSSALPGLGANMTGQAPSMLPSLGSKGLPGLPALGSGGLFSSNLPGLGSSGLGGLGGGLGGGLFAAALPGLGSQPSAGATGLIRLPGQNDQQ